MPDVHHPSQVMIVDDHELMRRGLSDLINGQPTLRVCAEARDVADALRQLAAAPDVVVVDIALHESNGLDLVRQLRAVAPQVRCVVYTMYDEELYAERAFRAGAAGFVNKQSPARELLQAIHRVLEGKFWMRDALAARVLARAFSGQPAEVANPLAVLSDRELEVFGLLGRGMKTGRIAEQLGIGHRTVETYRERLKTKLHLESSAELTRMAIQWLLSNAEGGAPSQDH